MALIKSRLLIEVDGCYWHGCEQCGFSGERAIRQKAKDAVWATKAQAEGWRVLRVWEHEVADHSAFAKLEEALQRTGVAP